MAEYSAVRTPRQEYSDGIKEVTHKTLEELEKVLDDIDGLSIEVPVVMAAKIVGTQVSTLSNKWIFKHGVLEAIIPGEWS